MASLGARSVTVTELLLARTGDRRTGLLFEGQRWTWAECVRESTDRAALLGSLRRPGPFHVGVLMDNCPELIFLLGGAALSGAVLVGLNPVRRGEELASDIRRADCQVVLTDSRYAELLDSLDGLDLGAASGRVMDIESAAWHVSLFSHRDRPLPPAASQPDDLLMLRYTAGTGGAPKPVRGTHRALLGPADTLAEQLGLGVEDTTYLALPLCHGITLTAGWLPALATGATVALSRRFSTRAFLSEAHDAGARYAVYSGRALTHILAAAQDTGQDCSLRLLLGCGTPERDVTEFARRFGCRVVDTYWACEDGIVLGYPPDTPPGALGTLPAGVDVLDPDTGTPCPPGAVGELVNTAGTGAFAGYYPGEDTEPGGRFHSRFSSGDLVHRDEHGYCYFAGRADERLWVGDEYVDAGPVERVLLGNPVVGDVAVYPVPDPAGDCVAAAIVLRPDAAFDPARFASFLAAQRDQGDLRPAQLPRLIRLTTRLPQTSGYQLHRRMLATQHWRAADPLWWREGTEPTFVPLRSPAERQRVERRNGQPNTR